MIKVTRNEQYDCRSRRNIMYVSKWRGSDLKWVVTIKNPIQRTEAGSSCYQGLNCQKISGGLTSAYSLSLPLHTGDSASLTTAGVETDPPRVSQGIMFGGVWQTTGGVQPPHPPAIQTLVVTLQWTASMNYGCLPRK
jgi:hypothetical protein